jgi:hypothetical protein
MEAALALADQCWGRANRVRPDFVERYLELAEQLLLTKPVVTGDEFREHCAVPAIRTAPQHMGVSRTGLAADRLDQARGQD